MSLPLAAKLRPQSLRDFLGQEHLVGIGQPLFQAIGEKHLFSFILVGPPGVGKTTLARIYAQAFNADFLELSAVKAGKAEVRAFADQPAFFDRPKILFLDEIHRFNKAQQDFLLPLVETNTLTLIGATTENPSFSIISALLSRLRVFTLEKLTDEQIIQLIGRAELNLDRETLDWLVEYAAGDGRQLLNILEATENLYGEISVANLLKTSQERYLKYDRQGDEHYQVISALIKSLRASNVDSALYYLARMVEAGEDPLFIARRLVIFAAEDVAAPTAVVVANAVFQACQQIGYPECQENLAAGVVYLAQAKKDRHAYNAYLKAQADVKKYGNLPVPLELRNPSTKLMKEQGFGQGYNMYPEAGHSLLPTKIKKKKYW